MGGDGFEAVFTEVFGVELVEDGVFPPGLGVHAGAGPAGAGEGLREGRGRECEGEEEGSQRGHGAPIVREMLPDFLGMVEMEFYWDFS